MGLLSSHGPAYKGKAGYAIVHEASTTRGWSGTPLYQGSTIVGVHIGCGKLGENNCATNVNLLLTMSSKQESVFSENSYNELDEDNFLLRDRSEYLEIDIKGRGKFLMGDADFINVTGKSLDWEKQKRAKGEEVWHDADDADMDAWYKSDIKTLYELGVETVKNLFSGSPTEESDDEENVNSLLQSLNCQRAAPSEDAVLPSIVSQSTSGRNQRLSPHGVCLSPTLEDRVANLEKLLERSLATMCKQQLENSQKLLTTLGLVEEVQQRLDLLSTKLVDLPPPAHQKTCVKPPGSLPGNTQEQQLGESSGETSGIKKKSLKKRKKSGKRKSTQKRLPESHSPSWVKATPKS